MAKGNFQCSLCLQDFTNNEIETALCNHIFCIQCLDDYITENLNFLIKCPVSSCSHNINDNIIRKIIDDDHVDEYDQIIRRNIKNSHCCILPECSYYILYDNKDFQFECPFCTLYNCIKCQAAHMSLECYQYQSSSAVVQENVCKNELNRAKDICLKKKIELQRNSIVKALSNASISNPKIFKCDLCGLLIRKKMGIQLRNCFHNICRDCLVEYIKESHDIPIPCPYNCELFLEDPEIREILSEEDKEIYNRKILDIAIPKLKSPRHCQKPGCENVVDIIGDLKSWKCVICKSVNCVSCKAIHPNQTCKEYLRDHSQTENYILQMIERKELMRCPSCKILIEKSSGCNWIKCKSCSTELCWINQTYRWGPKGPGDTSGGCRCNVNGKKCHKDCSVGCIPDYNIPGVNVPSTNRYRCFII